MVFLLNKISHAGKGSTRRQRTSRTDFFAYSLIHSTPAKYPVLCWALRMDANNFSSRQARIQTMYSVVYGVVDAMRQVSREEEKKLCGDRKASEGPVGVGLWILGRRQKTFQPGEQHVQRQVESGGREGGGDWELGGVWRTVSSSVWMDDCRVRGDGKWVSLRPDPEGS